jgi:hypothetical protein
VWLPRGLHAAPPPQQRAHAVRPAVLGHLIGFSPTCWCAVPTVNEYFTIQRAVDASPQSSRHRGRGPRRLRQAADLEYSISAGGKDLDVTKENDKVVISFAYDKEIPNSTARCTS